METIITYGIIYLLVFRLAVLLLGGLCIFCGYRLFLVRGRQAGGGTGTADQGSELTVKSTAPGIFFAAFGAGIVIAVLAGSQPNVNYDEQRSSPQAGGQSQGQQEVTQRGIAMRSLPPPSSLPADAGTADYKSIYDRMTEAIDQGRNMVSRAPDNPDYHDLLARLLFTWGEVNKAAAEQRLAVDKVDAARRAVFQARLDLYQQAVR